jgi:hypothetical protein
MSPRLDTGGWLALTECVTALFPAGTFTLQDAPSFARRDNVKLSGAPEVLPRLAPPKFFASTQAPCSTFHNSLSLKAINAI